MKTVLKTAALILLSGVCSTAFAAENSSNVKISQLDTRNNGYHAIFLSGSVPDQGCTHSDRAIIKNTGTNDGAEYMEKVALAAMLNNKYVNIRVNGCARINPDQSTFTAPEIVRLSIVDVN